MDGVSDSPCKKQEKPTKPNTDCGDLDRNPLGCLHAWPRILRSLKITLLHYHCLSQTGIPRCASHEVLTEWA